MSALARPALLVTVLLSLVGAATYATAEQRIEFVDRIVRVKHKNAAGEGITVAFAKRAAVYTLERKLLGMALKAKRSGKPVNVTVTADGMHIVKIVPRRTSK